MKNNTWVLVDLPPEAKPIGCKWIFRKKYNPDGNMDKYKARLVAKRCTQKENIDYFNTFAPVTRISSICVLIALTSIHKLVIHQIFKRRLSERNLPDSTRGLCSSRTRNKSMQTS
jgi:hypothetical protein